MRPSKTIEYIDFAKGYAMLSIVLYHYFQKMGLHGGLDKAIIFGGTGIHLFFVLSGFGLTLSRPTGWMDFYKRRLSKIYIPFAVALTLSFIADHFFGFFGSGWDAWLAGIFMVHGAKSAWIESFGGHFWFIATILEFYLLYPLLVRWNARLGHPWGFWGLSLLLSACWWELLFLTGNETNRLWCGFFPQFLWEFVLGMVLAQTYQGQLPASNTPVIRGDFWTYSLGQCLGVGLFFIALMAVMVVKMGDIGRLFNEIPALIGYTALSVFVYQISALYFPKIKNGLLWLGKISFSIYLVHILWMQIWLYFGKYFGLEGPVFLLVGLVPLLGIAQGFEVCTGGLMRLLFQPKLPTNEPSIPSAIKSERPI